MNIHSIKGFSVDFLSVVAFPNSDWILRRTWRMAWRASILYFRSPAKWRLTCVMGWMVDPEKICQHATLGTHECGLIWREDLLVSVEGNLKEERWTQRKRLCEDRRQRLEWYVYKPRHARACQQPPGAVGVRKDAPMDLRGSAAPPAPWV